MSSQIPQNPGHLQNSQSEEPPKIEFPHKNYVIKVIGDAGPDYKSLVVSTVKAFAPDVNEDTLRISLSKNGRFESITMYFTATGTEQLEDIHNALKATGRVKMVI